MKAIIFAGIGLFAAATIYGITDFAADKKKGTIDKLYKEEPAPATAAAEANETATVPVAAVEEKKQATTTAPVKKATARKKATQFKAPEIREIRLSEFSRGRIIPKAVKKEVTAEPVVVEEKKDE